MKNARLKTWIDWYRFARDVLGDTHQEAVVYANLRYAEELNRDSRHRPAA